MSQSTCESSRANNGRSPSSPASVLFRNEDGTILLLDIPRSLEEAQVSPGVWPSARILSRAPPAAPFHTPEPRYGAATVHWPQSPAAHVADLMTAAAAQHALNKLKCRYPGPFYLPRLVSLDAPTASEAPSVKVPEGAEFLHGSVQDLRQSFIDTAPMFRLIVLDPPWPNRSTRRKTQSYNTASNLSELRRLLSDIPVPSHLAPDGLVAMWITNKASILEFLTLPTTGLFASWGLELVAEWTWLKVTASGEPLFALESTWRKPWERLLIAKRIGAKMPMALKPKVIIAVPDTHSRKPSLRQAFQDILGDGYPALEVFARSLTAGWWSWGDEVLRFQGSQHWSVIESQPK